MTRRQRQWCCLGGILATAYTLYAGFLWWQQDNIVFAGRGMPLTADLRELHAMASYVELEAEFGRVRACYLESDTEFDDGPIALVAHGNAETISHWGAPATHFHELGISLFLVEYPGYGGSEGSPDKATISEVFDLAHTWLEESRGLSRRKLIGIGQGFGSGPILELASRKSLDGLLLIQPFLSSAHLTRELGLPSFLLRTHYNNAPLLAQFAGPSLILHGEADRLIPFSHAKRLAANNANTTLHGIPDLAHKEIWKEPKPLLTPLKAWLETHGFAAETD